MVRDWKFWISKEEDFIRVAKTKALICFAVTAKLICAFVFAYADCWFSHVAAHVKHESINQRRSFSRAKLRGPGLFGHAQFGLKLTHKNPYTF